MPVRESRSSPAFSVCISIMTALLRPYNAVWYGVCRQEEPLSDIPGRLLNQFKMPGTKNIFFISISLITSNLAWSQSLPDSTAAAMESSLQPVEVRAVRAGSAAPFPFSEVKGSDIQKNNLAQDIPLLLQFTPSAVATSDAGTGIGYSGLRIRGTDGTRMNVTLNGIPVNDAESQGAFLVDLPDLASSVSSIQLQRGVGTSTNGPAAFGATMSISALDQMQKAGAEGSFSAGSFGTRKYTLKAGTGLLDNGWQFDVRLSKLTSEGYIQRSASDLKAIQFIAGYHIDPSTSLRFAFLTGQEKTGQAWNGVPQDSLATNRTYNELGLKSDGTYYDNQTDNYRQDYYQAFLDHQFNKHLTGHIALFLTRGKGYYEEYRPGEDFGDYGLPPFVSPFGADTISSTDLIRQLWLDNYFYGSVFSLLYQKHKTNLTFGGGYTIYEGDHYGFVKWAQLGFPDNHRWYLLDSRKTDLNLYVKAQHAIGSFILFGDVQYRNVAYDIDGFRKNPTLRPSENWSFFNPKAGLSWMVRNTASNRQKAYASFAMTSKEPNRDDFEASADVPKPETLYDVEAGYEVSRPKWGLSTNLYHMQYRDQLILTGQVNDVGAYARTNVPKSYRQGLELEGSVKPLRWLNIRANATMSNNKIMDFTEYVDNYDDGGQNIISHGTTDIAFSPNQVFAAIVSITPFSNLPRSQNLEFTLQNKYVGKQYLDNTSNDARSIDPYSLTDLRINYSVALKPFRELAFTLALNNILDETYESNGYTFSYIYGNEMTTQNYYYPQAGFNWLAGVTLKW
jgi:iron complex outermembrane receptor protein